MPRTVTLVLLDADGHPRGALPPFEVPVPWWPETADVVTEARRRHGVDLVVLRLLHATWPMTPDGGPVTYLAECDGPVPAGLTPAEVDLAPHPLRPPYAEPGGPAASLTWARGVLGAAVATQVRTWNLSSIWRLEHPGGTAWLKEVPAFFAHEGPLLRWLARYPGFAPTPIAVDGRRILMEQIEGDDHYGGHADVRVAALERLHRVQRDAAGAMGELFGCGVPDRRSPALAAEVRETVAAHGGDPALVADLDARFAAVAACGVPDTLVHGDHHAGNVKGTTTLDWGDAVVGHPAFDALTMVRGLPDADADAVLASWCGWWRAAVPDADPGRALTLLEPVEALRRASIYARFLDRIEPAEHPYHAGDVAAALAQAARLLAAEPDGPR